MGLVPVGFLVPLFVCLEGVFIVTVGNPWFIVLGVLLLVLAALLLGKMLISSEDEPIGMGWVITVAVGLLAVFVCAFIISLSLGVMLLVVFVLGGASVILRLVLACSLVTL